MAFIDFDTIITRLNDLTTKINAIYTNSKKIFDLPDATIGQKLVAVWNVTDLTTQKFDLSQALDNINQLNDRITAVGTITRDVDTFEFSVGFEWIIGGLSYQNTSIVELTPIEATDDYYRIDIAVLDTNNDIVLVQGFESLTIAEQPQTPPNTLFLCSFSIFGATIGTPTTPIVGSDYVKKIYQNEINSSSLSNITLPSTGQTSFNFSVGGFNIEGFDGSSELFDGKVFVLKNSSDTTINLVHNGTSTIKFKFISATNYDLIENEIITLRYSEVRGLEILGSNKSIASTPTLQQVTDEGNTAVDLPIIMSNTSNDNILAIESNALGFENPITENSSGITPTSISLVGINEAINITKTKITRIIPFYNTDIIFDNPTANRDLIVPNESGTFATREWVTANPPTISVTADDVTETATRVFVTPTQKTDYNSHIASTSNPHSVTKTQVGLSNVDNTSDLSKPISTATQTALDLKTDSAKLISANYTALNNDNLIINATCTITDVASPSNGTNYTATIVNGSVTIGGVAYTQVGGKITRIYNSGAWRTFIDTELIDYSNISTIVGFASYTTKTIHILLKNGIGTCFYHLAGVSNSTTKSFTLDRNVVVNVFKLDVYVQNNSTISSACGRVIVNSGSNVVDFRFNASGSGFTNVNNAVVVGQFDFIY